MHTTIVSFSRKFSCKQTESFVRVCSPTGDTERDRNGATEVNDMDGLFKTVSNEKSIPMAI